MAGTEERYCPICEERMYETRCPTDGVQTIPYAALKSSTSQLAPGAVIGERYRVEHLLGSGGMGSVYAATQITMDRRVALKVLVREAMRDGTEIKRFFLEAKNASRLKHPNVVRVYDFGIDEATQMPFIAMELVDGRTLRRLITECAPMPLPRVASLLEQVAKALMTAHGAGIIHRDLKPDNIMVGVLPGDDEHVTVLDFGIAKSVRTPGGLQESLTASGVVVGTPRYMSPEQVQGQPADARSDLYSLGCIFHEMLSGAPPFRAEDAVSLMLEHVNGPRPELPEIAAPTAVVEATRLLHGMLLAREPSFRPTSAEPVAALFRDLSLGRAPDQPAVRLAQPPVGAAAPSLAASLEDRVPTGGTDTQIKREPPLPTPVDSRAFDSLAVATPESRGRERPAAPTSRRLPLLGAAVILLMAIGGGVVLSTSSDDSTGAREEAVGLEGATAPSPGTGGALGDDAPAGDTPDAPAADLLEANDTVDDEEAVAAGDTPEATPNSANETGADAPSPPPEEDTPSDRVETPDYVTVVIRGSPSGASVRDRRTGERLGTLGEPIRLEYGTSRRALVVAKRAFISKVVTVTPDRDRAVTVRLIPDLAPRGD